MGSLVNGDDKRKKYLIEEQGKGYTPTESLYQEVSINPSAKDIKQQVHRILCLRELALGQKFLTYKESRNYWRPAVFTDQAKSLRKASHMDSCSGRKDSAPLQKISMRIFSYLRMINTEESIQLMKKIRVDLPKN